MELLVLVDVADARSDLCFEMLSGAVVACDVCKKTRIAPR